MRLNLKNTHPLKAGCVSIIVLGSVGFSFLCSGLPMLRLSSALGGGRLSAMPIFLFIAGIIMLLAVVAVVVRMFRGSREDALTKNGKLIRGCVVDCQPDDSVITIGSGAANCLLCESDEMPGIVFRSKCVYKDMSGHIGKEIDILVDRKDPSKYFVDVDGLSVERVDVLEEMRKSDAQRHHSDK